MSDLVTGQDGLARPVWAATDPLLRDYYDTEWGMPVRNARATVALREADDADRGLAGLVWSYRPAEGPR